MGCRVSLTGAGSGGKRLSHIVLNCEQMTVRGDPSGHYAALGLPLTATPEDIRRAFGERAKQRHPDQAGANNDPAAFQRVLDAYEVLRDPSRRLRYDADSVPMSRDDPAEPGGARVDDDPLARQWSPRRFWPSGRRDPSGSANGLRAGILLGIAGLCLTIAIAWIGYQARSIGEYESRIGQLTVDLERARADEAEVAARYRAASVVDLHQALADPAAASPASAGGLSHLFAANLTFPAGAADISGALDQQLLQSIEQVSAVVADIPPDRHWLVLIQGQAPDAAGPSGVEVAGWQLALLRISQVVDRLVQAGLPADRVAMRFSAGFAPGSAGSDPSRSVELRVVCCLR